MAKNRNEPQDDQSLEALLFAQKKQQQDQYVANSKIKEKELENQKEIVKNIQAVYTPVSKSQTSLIELNKNVTQYNKIIQSEISKNNELLKQNISNTKSLYDLLEKTFDPNKKQQVTTGKNKKEGKSNNDNFESKARHEQGILGVDDNITPLLSSIDKNTAEILKLLKEKPKNQDNQKGLSDPLSLPGMPKFMNWVIPAVVAAVATKHPEVGNGVKAGLGVATAAARVASPIVDAARAGVSTAAGASKLTAATQAARQAMTLANLKTSMQGPAKLGTMGKVGVGLGAGATIGRIKDEDYVGATAQGISTLLPLILSKTKYGKMAALASAGIDVGLLGRDYINYQDKKEAAEAEGKTVKSPIDMFTDDVKTLGAFIGIGDGPNKTAEAIDPVVQNTSETNKILTEIRDGKGGSGNSTGGGVLAGGSSIAATAVLGGLLAHRFGLLGKLAGGTASSGLGARIGAGIAGVGSNAGRIGSAGLAVAGTVGKKALGKLIPGVGLYMGATGAYEKIKEGDWTGAALEGGSGVASLFPGIGTAVALGLQGISATRDAIKQTNQTTTDTITATNAAQQASITKVADDTNKKVIANSDALTTSIQMGAANANKQIVDTSKTANDSLTKSATTLTNTSSSLSETLIKSSTTLLSMIGKMTPVGMAYQAGQAAYNFLNGEPTANENAQSYGSSMNKNRAGNQMMVYKSFLNAGMSPQQAKILTAEIGRENSYDPNEMFGSHTDHKNGLTNVGMLSWQKDRADKFMKFMKANGQIDNNGKIKWGQGSLDAQARFIKEELAGSYYNKAGNKFLNDRNISYADGAKLLGKNYIGWRYGDPKYANGHERRDRYYATLSEQLKNNTPITPTNTKKNVKYISQKEMDRLSKAAPKPPTPLGPDAMKKWEASEKIRVAELQKTQKGILSGSIVVGTAPKETTVSKTNTQPKQDAENKNAANIDNKEYYALGQKNVVVQNGVDIAGLQPNVRTQFYTMVGELFATKGVKSKVIVTSAYRSNAAQQALWNKKLKENNGDEAKTRKYVAPPGTSNHEKGLALDLDTKGSNNVAILDSSGLLRKYGFSRPMSHEPWHIEYGSGKASAAASTESTTGDPSAEEGPIDVGQVFSEGLASVLNSDAMNSVREFMKGTIDKPVDKYGKPTAMGTFTKDESDPTRTKPKDSGNGDMWENLDQQLGDGTLSRQERDQLEYEKVKKAFGGDGSIKRQERNQREYDKVKKAFGGSNAIFRQIGGKYGWLADIFGGLFGGDDTLLGSLFGILTGSQDISGLPNILGKSIIGNNPALESQGAVGGGFGGGLSQNNSESNQVSDGTETDNHLDGSVTKHYPDGSYEYTNKDGVTYKYNADGTSTAYGINGRNINYNADGTIASIDRSNVQITKPESVPESVVGEGTLANGVFTEDTSDGLPGGMRLPRFGGGIDLSTAMGGFGGGIAGGLGYDDTFTRYENSEFDQAKQYHQQAEESKMQVQVNIPEPVETPTQQAPAGGKSSQPGLGGGQIFTRNPDSIIQQVALAMLRSSV